MVGKQLNIKNRMEFKEYEFSYFINLMKTNTNFTLTKIGDGELISIFKYLKWLNDNEFGDANTDKHRYFNDMGEALHSTLVNEKGYYKYFHPQWLDGTINHPYLCKLLQKYVKDYDINPPNLCDSRKSFYVDAKAGNLKPLKEILEKRNFIMVSEKRKRNLSIKMVDFIETPLTNSWLEKDRIQDKMLKMTEKYTNPIFGISIGMPSLVIQDKLYPIIGDRATMINFGSMFDPFVNIVSRNYHRNYKTRKL